MREKKEEDGKRRNQAISFLKEVFTVTVTESFWLRFCLSKLVLLSSHDF